ncbi:hypothetical protein GBAR_LOCUS9661 [Geodia barretti]|uniref:Uncharacterized protein n=1 Tax=Geodia barretti TaxID=519541 RepID=A0AA35WBW8_GEOBA|nr:hypothetical protein GBAR_LOCUS9661 [Geodia barretti]
MVCNPRFSCGNDEVIVFCLMLLFRVCSGNKKDTMLVESSDPKIILSLLDGNVLSIDINTGIVLWSLSEDPILSIPDINAYRWDATYLEYNSYSSTPTINRDHLYFSSTTDDMLISIDPNTGNSTIYCTFGNLNLRSKEI